MTSQMFSGWPMLIAWLPLSMRKMHENEELWTEGCGASEIFYYIDPPLNLNVT